MLTSLVVGCAAILINASRLVQNEMRSALLVAEQTVDDVSMWATPSFHSTGITRGRSSPSRAPRMHNLAELVASFKGNQYLRVSVSDDGSAKQVNPVYDHRVFGGFPRWFIRPIGVVPETHRIPVTLNRQPLGAVVIETQPRNKSLKYGMSRLPDSARWSSLPVRRSR